MWKCGNMKNVEIAPYMTLQTYIYETISFTLITASYYDVCTIKTVSGRDSAQGGR